MSSVSRKTGLVVGAVLLVLPLATYGVLAGYRNRSNESVDRHHPSGTEHAGMTA
jgi:hypothetical protein